MNDGPHVWVVYKTTLANIFAGPLLVESLWDTEYGADQRAAELNGGGPAAYSTMGWDVRHADCD